MADDLPSNLELRRELFQATKASLFRAGKVIAVLSKMTTRRHPEFIADVAPLLWAKEEKIVQEAAATLAILIPRVPIGDLPTLDAQLRNQWSYGELDGPQIERLKSSGSWWGAFGVLASHRSGFVRQAAVEELAHEESGDALPFLLLRTTDWVEPVRKAAEEAFRQKLSFRFSDQLLRCLPLVFRLRNATRNQPLALLEEIEKIAASRTDFLATNLDADISPAFLRYRYQLARSHGTLTMDRLVASAIASSDPGVRMLACDCLKEAPASDLRAKYADKLFADKSALVRVRAYWRIANSFPEQYRAQIEKALLDPSAAVQDTARGAWRMLLHLKAGDFYRERITEVSRTPKMVAVLRGLRAESTVADESLVRPFLHHASIKIRREALRTLVTWDAPDALTLLLEALESKTPSYAKEAARLFLNRINLLPVTAVKSLLHQPAHPDSRRIALWLLVRMPKWSSLPLILAAYAIPSCRDRANEAFTDWDRHYNRVQTSPSKVEASSAVSAFQGIADLPLAKNRELVSIIRYLESLGK